MQQTGDAGVIGVLALEDGSLFTGRPFGAVAALRPTRTADEREPRMAMAYLWATKGQTVIPPTRSAHPLDAVPPPRIHSG